MKSLQDFASNDNQPLFPQANQLPEFFQHNLVDPARVVKVFTNDPQANIRIFYYQYLKLCFELDNVNYEFYINKIEEIINNEGFKFIFYQDDDPFLFSDLQFKNLIMQFFSALGDGNVTIDAAINRYPVMDTVFIYFFRAFLILTGKAQTLDSYVERDQLLQYLCSSFQVEITLHDKCIKFVQTDIFAYEEDPKQVFMAFMDYDRVQNYSQMQPAQQDGPSYYQQNGLNSREANEFFSNISEHMQAPAYLSSHEEIAENVGYQNAKNSIPPVSLKDENELANNSISKNPVSNHSSRKGTTEINQSYIASEFMDYTTSNHYNYSGLQQKATLKDSGQIDAFGQKQYSAFKSGHLASSFEGLYKKTDGKASGFRSEQNNTFPSESKINASNGFTSQTEQSYNVSSCNNTMSSYVGKTNFNAEVPLKRAELQENKYIAQNDRQPTKDPGFNQHYSINQYISSATYQKPVSPSSTYQPLSSPQNEQAGFKSLQQKKPSSQSLHTSDSLPQFESRKPTGEANKPVTSYVPSYQTSYQSSYNSNNQSGVNKNQNSEPVASKLASVKNPFGLNVSLEFTNSFTMKAMSEPFRTNVATIRQRARNFRNSLMSFIK